MRKKVRSPLDAKLVLIQHSINCLCPLCQALAGNGEGDAIIIMSHFCRFKRADDILQSKQSQGHALESWH